jgi:hypothetical protein
MPKAIALSNAEIRTVREAMRVALPRIARQPLRGEGGGVSEGHHVIPKQRIKIRRSAVAIKDKRHERLSPGERRLLVTPLTRILADRRNIVRISRKLHHRAHQGFERLTAAQLPAGLQDFAADYGLEAALDHELRLLGISVEELESGKRTLTA